MTEYGYGQVNYGGIRFSWPDWVFTDAVSGFVDVNGAVSEPDIELNGSSGEVFTKGSIGIANLSFDNINAEVEVFGSISQPDIEMDADAGQVGVLGSIGKSQIVGRAVSPDINIEGTTSRPELEFDATNPEVSVMGSATLVILEHNATSPQVDVEGNAIDLEEFSSVIDADALSGTVEITANDSETNWDALLGGVVKDPQGIAVEGAEVHIIRDNDDTKVATTTTDSNGEWSVTLPAGNDPRPDPPVWSIQVWYRDGNKRDPDAKLFNATNRPYIDSKDPSSTNPYQEFNNEGDKP